jgi:D-alanyl-lipoteichoic acid acyltransferase DltB (MBOAT superfamily)
MNTLTAVIDTHLLIGLAVAVAFSIVIPAFSSLQRIPYLGVVSLIGAALYHWEAFPGFVIVNAIAYVALCWLNGARSARWQWACMAMLLLITAFTLGRVFHWDRLTIFRGSAPLALYSLDMWLALRLITLFWEVGSGSAVPSLSSYVIWTCLPLTLGGPLLRYSQFPAALGVKSSLWKSRAWWLELAAATAKLITGLALAAAQQVMSSCCSGAHFWINLTNTLLTGPVGFYLTTAGYFHLMEVLGRPAGYSLPTSFNFPLGRENISAFWMNWNMTATGVFRDYLFYNRWGLRTYNIYFNTMVLFVLVGLWHSANAYWLLFGFLHGLLFCSFLIWRRYGNRLGHIPLRGTPAARASARVLTYICVCACWYLPSKILQKLASA